MSDDESQEIISRLSFLCLKFSISVSGFLVGSFPSIILCSSWYHNSSLLYKAEAGVKEVWVWTPESRAQNTIRFIVPFDTSKIIYFTSPTSANIFSSLVSPVEVFMCSLDVTTRAETDYSRNIFTFSIRTRDKELDHRFCFKSRWMGVTA